MSELKIADVATPTKDNYLLGR